MVGHWSGMGGDGWTRASDGGWAEKSVGHWAGMVGDGWNEPAVTCICIGLAEASKHGQVEVAGLEWLDTGQGWVVTAGPGPAMVAGPRSRSDTGQEWSVTAGTGQRMV